MKLSKEYVSRYMPEMILDQVSEDYEQKGYYVERDFKLEENIKVDLVARKNDEVILVEVKAANRPISKIYIERLNAYVKSHPGYKLVIAVASPPERKKIEIENIDDIIFRYLIANPPSELSEHANHISFNYVSEVEISDLKVSSNDEISVSGAAMVGVHLQYGSESDVRNDDGQEADDNFEIKFHLALHYSDQGWATVPSDQNSIRVMGESLYV